MAFDPKRSATAGNFVLEIGDTRCSYLKSFSGLAYEADIATNEHGPENFQTKHQANFKFSNAKASVGMAMGKEMNEWIKASFKKEFLTKHGAFVAADFNFKESHRVEFTEALICSVGLPKLDGADKNPCYFDIEFEAETVHHVKGGGSDIRGNYGTKAKAWLASCFKFELAGLEDSCKRVATIDAMQLKQTNKADEIGEQRIYTKHPCKIVVPDIKLTISSADQEPWRAWAQDWFLNGKSLAADHKDGCITYLAPDMKTELGKLELKNCGLKKFADEDYTANSDKIKRFTVELYCEEMEFNMTYVD
jgi:hypothetical protein